MSFRALVVSYLILSKQQKLVDEIDVKMTKRGQIISINSLTIQTSAIT